MADVSISDLTTGVPLGSDFIPYTTGSVTNKTLVSSITAASQPLNYVGASVFKGVNSGAVNSTILTCSFNSVTFDSNGFYNAAVAGNTRLTVPAGLGGMYLITGYLTTSTTNAYAKNSILLIRNTVTMVRNDTSMGGNGLEVAMTTSTIASLAAGEYIRLQGFCDGFWSLNQFKDATLTMIRLGA